MPRRFPKSRSDGSFKIRVRFNAPPADLASTQLWVEHWVRTHGEWVFLGKSHRFDDYFSAPPSVLLGANGELCLIFRGVSPDRRFWKDWYVRLVGATLEAFPVDFPRYSGHRG